jgi:hypothetical protein
MTHRIPVTAACLLIGLGAMAGVLTGCQQAGIVQPTPDADASATPAGSAGYTTRYGDNPVAASDARDLERRLVSRGEYWEAAISTEPAAAGFPRGSGAAALGAARAGARRLALTIATESLPTIRELLARGRTGQQAYCAALLEEVRALGYGGLESASVVVYFTEKHRHAELAWSPTGATYTVFDNDQLGGDLSGTPSGTTPFPAPPTP